MNRRYVEFSIRCLAQQFEALRATRDEIQVKVFGGADVLPSLAERTGKPTIGALNADTALAVLAEEGFKVMAQDPGGARGCRIQFHTGTVQVARSLALALLTRDHSR